MNVKATFKNNMTASALLEKLAETIEQYGDFEMDVRLTNGAVFIQGKDGVSFSIANTAFFDYQY